MNLLKPTSIRRFSSLKVLRGTTNLQILRRSGGIPPEAPLRLFSSAPDPDPTAKWSVTVPDHKAFVIERDGKYSQTLYGGTHSLIPNLDKIAHVHSLEEKVIEVKTNLARTRDLVRVISVTGDLHLRIVDPVLASYHHKIEDTIPRVAQLAQTVVSSRIREMALDAVVIEIPKDRLWLKYPACAVPLEEMIFRLMDKSIVEYINEIAKSWGLLCSELRFTRLNVPPEDLDKLSVVAEHLVRRSKSVEVIFELEARAIELLKLIEEGKGKADDEGKKEVIKKAQKEASSMDDTIQSWFYEVEYFEEKKREDEDDDDDDDDDDGGDEKEEESEEEEEEEAIGWRRRTEEEKHYYRRQKTRRGKVLMTNEAT